MLNLALSMCIILLHFFVSGTKISKKNLAAQSIINTIVTANCTPGPKAVHRSQGSSFTSAMLKTTMLEIALRIFILPLPKPIRGQVYLVWEELGHLPAGFWTW